MEHLTRYTSSCVRASPWRRLCQVEVVVIPLLAHNHASAVHGYALPLPPPPLQSRHHQAFKFQGISRFFGVISLPGFLSLKMESSKFSDQSAADRKRPLVPKEDDSDSKMQIMVLGSGQEVGRSCIMIKYQRKTVMLDCGTHPARSGESSLPFFDAWDLSEVDVALISHFHIDHAAAVPYLTERTAFKGKVYMTHPTKSIFKLVCDDIVNVNRNSNSGAANEPLYTSQHVQNCLKRIEVCQYHQTIEEKGIKFTAYNAGHVLGAAMFMVEIDGVRVLYTGDYSRHEDRHLEMAELPRDSQNEIISPDILIVESTYGTQNNQSRQERESLFAKHVKDTVTSGGNALVPMFAIGRAQELMLILDEEWSRDESLQKIPIFYFGDMAKKCLIAYDTYLSLMNEDIRKRHLEEGRSPFKFKHIKHVTKTSDKIFMEAAGSPCVAIASPGMLQSGASLELFERHVAAVHQRVVSFHIFF
jgi:cleavage and polyadenylation specificity factor subunit 3